jgi:hypothetical protein
MVTPRAASPVEPERQITAAAVAAERAPQKAETPHESPLPATELYAHAVAAVVQVVAIDNRQPNMTTNGTGFLVSKTGLIATNYHVIRNADSVHVVLADKTELSVSGIGAWDREADLAILRVSGKISAQPLELSGDGLPPVGTRVYAIGNPSGFVNTLSDGLVSAHREPGSVPLFPKMPTLIQTAAAASHGSSGGPLLTADGRVAGVLTLAFKRDPNDPTGENINENLNLAVPVSHVARLLQRSDEKAPLTVFPLEREPVARLTTSADKWSPEDVENATHFVRAYRASDAAWAIFRKADRPWQPGDPPEILNGAGQAQNKNGRPWLLNSDDLGEFVRLVREANREARMVRSEVLLRMHPRLPDAFKDFIISTSYIANNATVSRPEPRYVAMWKRWGEWRLTNRADVRVPKGAKDEKP